MRGLRRDRASKKRILIFPPVSVVSSFKLILEILSLTKTTLR